MFNTEDLLAQLDEYAKICDVPIDSIRSQILMGNAFVITDGAALFLDKNHLSSGHTATQTFKVGDPIGFAEVISKQVDDFLFKEIEPVSLKQINGDLIREAVETCHFLPKEIIRYSIARIFKWERSRTNPVFEDRLIETFRGELESVTVRSGRTIFNWGTPSGAIFFIEKGSVNLQTLKNRTLATLGETECFGESSLISDRRRSLKAVANGDCQLFRIDELAIKQRLEKENPLVQLALIQVVKRLHLMNQLRLIGSGDNVFDNS